MDLITSLPQECIVHIISFTSPRDACKATLVSHALQSAADSDATWETFLPSNYREIIATSASSSFLCTLSKKQLFFHLCDNPILVDDGTMSFRLEKETGKKCYMIGARGLSIIWGDSSSYWTWKQLPESRFIEVAQLRVVWWLDVKGKIKAKILSSSTTYAAYLVFKFAQHKHGFERRPIESHVYFDRKEGSDERRNNIFLDPSPGIPQLCQDRGDGWMEIEMGDLHTKCGDDGIVVCSLWGINNYTSRSGLIIEGIELRPKVV